MVKSILKTVKKELLFKIITSIFIQGLLLIIPVFWSRAINNLTDGIYNKAYYMVIVLVILSLLYYLWSYFNQKTWYKLYNKLYLNFTNEVVDIKDISKVKVGEYNNILNNDIDIICNFLSNLITRIIQVLEFLVIYAYFLSLNIYIFLITVIVSLLMVVILIITGDKVQKANINRKAALDEKTIANHNLYNSLIDNKNNKRVVSIFNKELHNYLHSNYKYNILAQSIIYIILGIIEIARYGLIFYGVYLISIGNMEIGTIVLIYTYYSKISTNFENLGTISADYRSFIVSLKRLNYVKDNNYFC